MKKLLNMSHPLTTEALARLEEMEEDAVEQVLILVQIDFDAPIKPQFDALVQRAEAEHFDLFIPPSLGYAAAYVTARLSVAQSYAFTPTPPAIVVMAREGEGPFQKYMPKEIVR